MAQNAVELSGSFQGENLLVVNETNPDGVGFCCYQVRVNGRLTADQVNSHAFEVDLRGQGIPLGKGVAIKLMHRPGCAPRVLNPEVILPSPDFELVAFEAWPTGEVAWTSEAEKGRMPFVLQQFKWGKWVDVLRVDGQGGDGQREYTVRIEPVRGENLLRLMHLAPDGTLAIKGEVSFVADLPVVDFDYDPKTAVIRFSEPTHFEIVDAYGTIVMSGRGDNAVLRYLARGEYFVNFGARSETFKKR